MPLKIPLMKRWFSSILLVKKSNRLVWLKSIIFSLKRSIFPLTLRPEISSLCNPYSFNALNAEPVTKFSGFS